MRNKLLTEIKTVESEKTEIIIFKSTIERAKNLFNALENKNKKEDPITRAKKILYILESLEK